MEDEMGIRDDIRQVVRTSEKAVAVAAPEIREKLRQQLPMTPTAAGVAIAEQLVSDSDGRVASREKASIAGLYNFASALDAAGEAFDASTISFNRSSAEFIDRLRSTRMAVTSEIAQAMAALKDAAAFIKALDDQKSFALLGHLVDLGKQCRDAFGPDGLSKLAEALLIESDRKERAS